MNPLPESIFYAPRGEKIMGIKYAIPEVKPLLASKAVEKRDNILAKLAQLKKSVVKEDVTSRWMEHDMSPTNKYGHIAGEDGSHNSIPFVGYVLYAVETVAMRRNFNDPSDTPTLRTYNDVDVIRPYKYVQERIGNYMAILELKNMYKMLAENPGIELMLFDGSIQSHVFKPYVEPRLGYEKKVKKEFVIEEILPLLEQQIAENNDVVLISPQLYPLLLEKLDKESANITQSYVEYLEKLLVLKKLFDFKDKIVAISKTSTSMIYFRKEVPEVPDIALFSYFTQEPGYSIELMHLKERPDLNPYQYVEIEKEFFKRQELVLFYARLKKNYPVLKFELMRPTNDREVKEILSALSMHCYNGYPVILRKVHEEAKITRKQMENIASLLELISTSQRQRSVLQ